MRAYARPRENRKLGAAAPDSPVRAGQDGPLRMHSNNNSIDADQLIDERPMSRTQILVAVLCAAAILIDGYG